MKTSQKNYLDNRLREVKGELVLKLKKLYGPDIGNALTQKEKLELILSGEVKLDLAAVKEELDVARVKGYTHANWPDFLTSPLKRRPLNVKQLRTAKLSATWKLSSSKQRTPLCWALKVNP